jgi:hypothetical protein
LEKSKDNQLFHLPGIDTEPDWHALDTDPDPAK